MPLLLLLGAMVHAACPPAGQSKASLQALKRLKFASPDAAARQALADGLVDCLIVAAWKTVPWQALHRKAMP